MPRQLCTTSPSRSIGSGIIAFSLQFLSVFIGHSKSCAWQGELASHSWYDLTDHRSRVRRRDALAQVCLHIRPRTRSVSGTSQTWLLSVSSARKGETAAPYGKDLDSERPRVLRPRVRAQEPARVAGHAPALDDHRRHPGRLHRRPDHLQRVPGHCGQHGLAAVRELIIGCAVYKTVLVDPPGPEPLIPA